MDHPAPTIEGLPRGTSIGETRAARLVLSPGVVLGAIVVAAFAIYATLGVSTPAPRVFPDELMYFDAAGSLAAGDGLEAREAPYGRALLYPLLLTPLLAVFDREVAYELAKCLNALLFALAAVPVFLVARRLLAPWPSVAVAALSIAIPSAMYVSVVMTESLAYLAFWWCVYAILCAVERPTTGRQLVALAAIVVAYLARGQFLLLYAAYVLALVIRSYAEATLRRPTRADLRGLWPTIAFGVVGIATFVLRPLISGGSPTGSFGEYDDVVRLYSPWEVSGYLALELINLELYLGILPLALTPIVLVSLLRRSRAGDRRSAAFVAVFVSVNAVLFALIAAVDSIAFRNLHDRYLFYVVPLWFIALFLWLARPQARPWAAVAIGFVLALSAVFVPLANVREHPGHWAFHALGSSLPKAVADVVGSDAVGPVALALIGVALLATALRLRERASAIVVAVLAVVLAVNAAAAWATAADPPSNKVFVGPSVDRRWIDHQVGASEGSVTTLYVACDGIASVSRVALDWYGFLVSEFFNASVGTAVQVDPANPDTARVNSGGNVVVDGERIEAQYVLAQQGATIVGRRVSQATTARLVLWQVEGPVRLSGATSNGQLRNRVCRRGNGDGL